MSAMDVHYSAETVEWDTPADLFAELDAEFHFQTDVCSTPDKAKCPRFFTPEVDGLRQAWSGMCWMNPPYGREIPQWIKKAYDSAAEGSATVACLLPARTDTRWFHEFCGAGEIRFLKGRQQFGDSGDNAPFPGNNILAESEESSDDGVGVCINLLHSVGGAGGCMAVFESYFDESERKGGIFCVAGYAFLPRQARRFISEWNRVFAPFGGFHMKDLVHRRNGFEGISGSCRDQLLRDAVRIVNQRMQFGVAVSCRMDEIMLHSQLVNAFSRAYGVCCYLAMVQLVRAMEKANSLRPVYYTFEAGHPYEADAREFVRALVGNPEVKRDFHHAGDSFLPKKDAVPLQAADLLAWEWAKCKDETVDQKIRPIRQSLLALFARDPKRYQISHITGEKLVKWLGVMPAILKREGIIDESGQTKIIH